MVKASVVFMVKRYWYPCHLSYWPNCKVRMHFPAESLIFNRAFWAEWCISPLTAHINNAKIEKKPPSLPHLHYLCRVGWEKSWNIWWLSERGWRWCCEGAFQKVGGWLGVGCVQQLPSANCKECMDKKGIWMVLINWVEKLMYHLLKIHILNWWPQFKLSIINYFQWKSRLHGTRQLNTCN